VYYYTFSFNQLKHYNYLQYYKIKECLQFYEDIKIAKLESLVLPGPVGPLKDKRGWSASALGVLLAAQMSQYPYRIIIN
jgi:hypothetical protein